MKKQPVEQKPYWEMTADELAAATQEFDDGIPLKKTRPLTAEERKMWSRLQKGEAMSVYVRRSVNESLVELDPEVRRKSMACRRPQFNPFRAH